MAKIVKVDPQTVTVEMNSGKQKTYPIGAVEFGYRTVPGI